MASRILAILSFAGVLPLARGQTADEFYHRAATNYIFVRVAEAKAAVESGLKAFPEDPKLGRMMGLLAREQQQQSRKQSQPQQGQDGPRKQEPRPGLQPSQLPQEQPASSPPEGQDPREQKPQEQDGEEPEPSTGKPAGQDQQKPESKPGSGKDQDDQPQAGGTADASSGAEGTNNAAMGSMQGQPGQMTREQARQLLEAARMDEKAWQPLPARDPRKINRKYRDW